MRIVQVVHGFPPKNNAGTEIYTYHLSKELAKKHEVHVFYPVLDKTKLSLTIHSFERDNLQLHELVIPDSIIYKIIRYWKLLFFENTYINKKIEQRFEALLYELNPDIVHFEHLIKLSATLIDTAKGLGIPTILTLHDYWFMCPNIQLLNYNYLICNCPRVDLCRECWIKRRADLFSEALPQCAFPKLLMARSIEILLKVLNSPKKFKKRCEYLRHLLLRVNKIIAPSKFLREKFINYGIPEDKIIYSENGYNLKIFKDFKKKKKNTTKLVFGFVGRISPPKGIHVLLDAFMNVPEDKAELRIYGSYDINSRYVKTLFKKIKNKKNIFFMGRFEDVREPYSEIDILVVPSIWHETGGPLVVKEALATKTPVIASRRGSIPELIAEGINGLLFEPTNFGDLYEKIMQIINNPELIETFKTNIKPPKSVEEQAKELEGIYKRIVYTQS